MPYGTEGTRFGKKDTKYTACRIEGGKESFGARKKLTLLDSPGQCSIIDEVSHDSEGVWCCAGRGGDRHDDWMIVRDTRT